MVKAIDIAVIIDKFAESNRRVVHNVVLNWTVPVSIMF